ncbi:unnamed protein product [Blepharisma stoltei]|uniref:Uncharacterized protein n=1 Tax=Blepharisma stoltei TaxID=1481888 RepID=A0AAU9K5X4_9CILI|nr:unnamed protein product [Blepharisma stoltei]
MSFPKSKTVYDDKKYIDTEFANYLRGVTSVHFETEYDLKLEREARANIERLTQEEQGSEGLAQVEVSQSSTSYNNPPKSIPSPVSSIPHADESGIGTLASRGSRRKRTFGGDNSRPGTAPGPVKPLIKQTSIEPKPQIASSVGFEQRPFTSNIHEEAKIPKFSEEDSSEKMQIKLLEAQLTNLLAQKERLILDQRIRFENQFKQECKLLETEHQNNLQQLKDWFDAKQKTLETSRRQQEKLLSLSQIISKNTQTITDLAQQFTRDKNYSENIKEQEFVVKEKSLDQRQNKINLIADQIEQEKQKFLNRKKNAEEAEEQRRNMIWQEKEHLKSELEKLERFQEEMKEFEREQKKNLSLEQHKVNLAREEHEREEKMMWEEVELQEKSLYEKELEVENEKNQAISEIQQEKSSIQVQLSSIDNFVKNISNLNLDLNYRSKICEEKEKDLDFEVNYNRKQKEELERNKEEFNVEAQKVHELSIEIGRQTENIVFMREELSNVKLELNRKKQEALNFLSTSKMEKLKTEQKTKELLTRMRSFENIRFSSTRTIEIPKLEPIDTGVLSRPVSPRKSRGSLTERSTFRASEYLKDIEKYVKDQHEFHSYLHEENNDLLAGKILYEGSFTESLSASIQLPKLKF